MLETATTVGNFENNESHVLNSEVLKSNEYFVALQANLNSTFVIYERSLT